MKRTVPWLEAESIRLRLRDIAQPLMLDESPFGPPRGSGGIDDIGQVFRGGSTDRVLDAAALTPAVLQPLLERWAARFRLIEVA